MSITGTYDHKYHSQIINRLLANGWRFGGELAEFPNPNPEDGNFTAQKTVYYKNGQQMRYDQYKAEYDKARAEIREEKPF
jgi:hypothetical protein